jgi:hypothetical protein
MRYRISTLGDLVSAFSIQHSAFSLWPFATKSRNAFSTTPLEVTVLAGRSIAPVLVSPRFYLETVR